MKRSVSVFYRLVITVTICLAAGFFSSVPASNGETIMGGEIPLMDGADIVKESLFNGSGRFELEVDASPEKVADFYKQAMEKKGWPPGMVMSIGNQSVLMLNRQGDQFVLKAESKNGKTKVTIALIRKAQAQDAATGSLPSTDTTAAPKGISPVPQSETVPQNSGMIIEGAPPTKGSLVQKIVVPPSQGEEFGKKDPGSLPEDPSPDPEDSSSSSSSDTQSTEPDHAADEIPEMLPVSFRVTVRWDVVERQDSECYTRYKGLVTYQFNGVMKLYAAGSPTIQIADRVLMPTLNYKPEVMTLTYTYNEKMEGFYPKPKDHCQDPLTYEHQGGGVSQIDDDNAARLQIVRWGSAGAPYLKNLSADKQQFLASMQLSTATPDYYEFYVAGPGQKKTIPGRKRVGSKDCLYQSSERKLSGLGGMVQMKIPESGAMQGTRTWSADDKGKCPPTLSIFVSDITPILEKSSLKPPEGGKKNVTYTVSWMVGETADYANEFGSEDNKKKKKPCDIIKRRIKNTKINKKLYSNENIKDYYKNKFGEKGYKEYNNGIEKIAEHVWAEKFQTAAEAEQFIDNLTENDIEWMENNKPLQPPGQDTRSSAETRAKLDASVNVKDPCDIRDMTLIGYLGEGQNRAEVDMIEFEKGTNNEWTGQRTENYRKVEDQYKKEYGPEAGKALFESMVEHEITHARQYARSCFSDTIDKVSEYEMEAYDVEIECLESYYDKWKCD